MTITQRTEPGLSDITRRGLEIYETALKPLLEPEHNGQVVAIDIESGDYTVAETSPTAMRALRKRRPQAVLLLRTIGPETRHGLAMRAAQPATPPGE